MSIWATTFAIDDDDDSAEGTVRQYQRSHVYPDPAHDHAEVDLAEIPAWCVPGHEDEHDSDAVGPWLRLGTDDGGEYAPAVLGETAVLALRDALTRWLDTPKVHPEENRA